MLRRLLEKAGRLQQVCVQRVQSQRVKGQVWMFKVCESTVACDWCFDKQNASQAELDKNVSVLWMISNLPVMIVESRSAKLARAGYAGQVSILSILDPLCVCVCVCV